MFAHREGDVVVNRQVAEQPAHLKHHAHLTAQGIQIIVAELVYRLTQHLDAAAIRFELAADLMQQRTLAAPAHAQYRDHLAARDIEIDAVEYLAFAVGEMQIADFDQIVRCRLVRGSIFR